MRSHTAKIPPPDPEPQPQRSDLHEAKLAPRKPRRGWVWVLLAIIAGSGWFALRNAGSSDAGPLPIATAPTRKARAVAGVLERTLRITGVTMAATTATLRAPQMSGRRSGGGGHTDFTMTLEEIAAQGSRVKKGDVLASFDRLYMTTRLDDYRASRLLHESNVQVLHAGLTVKREAHRQRIRAAKGRMEKAAFDLQTSPVRSANKIESMRIAHEEAQIQYRALLEQAKFLEESEMASIRYTELDLKESKMEERRAESNLETMVTRAPINGFASAVETFRGSENTQIRAGDQISPGQLFMRVDDPSSIVVEASANQVDVQELRMGARAQVMFDAYPGLQLPARLYSVDPITTGSRYRPYFVKRVRVRLRLERTDPRVISDLTVNADLVLESEKSSAIIPLEAVSEDPQSGQSYAFVEDSGGWKRKDLDLGLRNNTSVAVASGLEEGAVVAAGPIRDIR